MKKEKESVIKYRRVLEVISSMEHPNQFLHEGRMQMMEKLILGLDPYVNFKEGNIKLLNFCVALVDLYRTGFANMEFNIKTSGDERIPSNIKEIFNSRFNVVEMNAIGRNLSAIIDFSPRGLSSTQAMLVWWSPLSTQLN